MDLNTFTIDQLPFQTSEVFPNDCKKYRVGLGATPNEKDETNPVYYMDVLFNNSSTEDSWVFGATFPITFS